MIEWGYSAQRAAHRIFKQKRWFGEENRPAATTGKMAVKAQIINLLTDLKARLGLTMLFISHDLAVVQHISDRVAVMYLGHIMEVAGTREFFNSPRYPYTLALMEAIPMPDPRTRRTFKILEGDIPSPINPPSGCVFRTRCAEATPGCASVVPELKEIGSDHAVACLRFS